MRTYLLAYFVICRISLCLLKPSLLLFTAAALIPCHKKKKSAELPYTSTQSYENLQDDKLVEYCQYSITQKTYYQICEREKKSEANSWELNSFFPCSNLEGNDWEQKLETNEKYMKTNHESSFLATPFLIPLNSRSCRLNI